MNRKKMCNQTIEKYYEPIYRYCLGRLDDEVCAAEDCIQDVFVLLLEKKNSLDFSNNIRGWLYAAADRVIMKYKKITTRRLSMINTDIDEIENIPDLSPYADETSVFDVLDEQEYNLLIDYYTADYGSRTELAKKYGLSVTQLYKQVYYIKKKLRDAMDRTD